MPCLLLVEDSKMLAQMLKEKIRDELGLDVVWTTTLFETRKLLASGPPEFIAALLDLNLPDAPTGQVVDCVLARGIPSVVFTSDLRPEVREKCWSKGIVDYVLKEGLYNVDYVVSVVRRLQRNPAITVLVVDDAATARQHMAALLRVHRFRVIEAENGLDALRILGDHQDTRLVITDYNMPHMDGCELTKAIRSTRPKDQVAVIGVSATDDSSLSARFIKSGANDYLNKPFSAEELYCRVSQNVEMLEYIDEIQRLSNSDPLTGLSNRRHFFQAAKQLCAKVKDQACRLTVAMLDIDFFKKINDTFGHEAGDVVLTHIAGLLTRHFGRHLVARFGGEEFCVVIEGPGPEETVPRFEDLRRELESSSIAAGERTITVTASIGVCARPGVPIADMLREADNALYAAKEAGRNRVCVAG